MIDTVNLQVVWIFLIGVVITAIFQLEDILSSKELTEKNWFKITALVFLNGLLGGFVMVAVFYALEQYAMTLNIWVKVGIAGGVATMGKDGIKLFHKRVRAKAEVVK